MKTLPPMRFKHEFYLGIEAQIMAALNRLIFDPIREVIKGSAVEITNAKATPLLRALINGHVYYQNGEFRGLLNASISRELKGLGATWNRISKAWSIPKSALPAQVITAMVQSDSYYTKLNHDILGILDNVQLDNLPPFQYAKSIDEIDQEFRKVTAAMTVVPKLTEDSRRFLDEQWGSNLKLYVKGWAEENILKMRQQVMQNTLDGQRAGNLVKLLQHNYGVTKSKAKFLARQETSLLMSKMRQQRYAGIGISKYKWSTSHDERVRPMHRALNGKIFAFSEPPITAPNGARNNPGEDFNCRCQAIPVIENA